MKHIIQCPLKKNTQSVAAVMVVVVTVVAPITYSWQLCAKISWDPNIARTCRTKTKHRIARIAILCLAVKYRHRGISRSCKYRHNVTNRNRRYIAKKERRTLKRDLG